MGAINKIIHVNMLELKKQLAQMLKSWKATKMGIKHGINRSNDTLARRHNGYWEHGLKVNKK